MVASTISPLATPNSTPRWTAPSLQLWIPSASSSSRPSESPRTARTEPSIYLRCLSPPSHSLRHGWPPLRYGSVFSRRSGWECVGVDGDEGGARVDFGRTIGDCVAGGNQGICATAAVRDCNVGDHFGDTLGGARALQLCGRLLRGAGELTGKKRDGGVEGVTMDVEEISADRGMKMNILEGESAKQLEYLLIITKNIHNSSHHPQHHGSRLPKRAVAALSLPTPWPLPSLRPQSQRSSQFTQ